MVAREQFAWVWLLTLVVTYTVYFTAVVLTGETTFWTQIVMFAATAIVQVVIIATVSAVIALRRKDEVSGDERDLAIEQRATAVAYNILVTGIVLVGCVLPFTQSGWKLFNAAVFAIALAEIVRHGLIIVMYRKGLKESKASRGWHG
ncbi:MAG TPA: hypothetical protein DHW63_12505 [Hyphomonadaceae bacterium]|nr:hypothetical protein [Hyphomonadaceae bacterium]